MSVIRAAEPADATAIAAILNPIIANTTITFSPDLVTEDDVRGGLQIHSSRNDPYLVASHADKVIGFAKYGPFRNGAGYGHTVEVTLHLAPKSRGQGIGSALMTALENHARTSGKHSLIAGISAENEVAVAFHSKMGFTEIARVPRAGHKFARYIDLVLMQKFL